MYNGIVRRTREQVVADFEERGFAFRTFAIEHDSPHALADWDWNQRDLAHVPRIHGGFRFIAATVGEEGAVGFYLQRLLGLRVPLLVAFDHDGPRSRTYRTTLGPFVLLIEAGLEPLAAGTRVRTTYSVGGPRRLRFVLPWAERFLRRNYARLTDEDEPLRRRRTELRGWGYRFAADESGPGYRRSLDLSACNVRPPDGERRALEHQLTLDRGGSSGEWRLGRDDHLGLRVVRDGRRVRVFERMCRHEGASLDACPVDGGALECPWHGRRVAPIATFELGGAAQTIRTERYRLTLDGSVLRIAPATP